MGVNYTGLLHGNLNPIDVVKLIKKHYGGDQFAIRFAHEDGHYVITFHENMSDEVKAMRPWERKNHLKWRQMHLFVDGCAACDHVSVTTDPATALMLGHSGDCQEIIDPLVRLMGGWVKDGFKDDAWERLPALEAA